MDGSFARYCAAVCDQVRFRPDRAAIQSELWDHLEDHAAALEEMGLSQDEAMARAVEAMCDPMEVGKALDTLHSPVAGWLLLALTWCAKACGVAALILLFLSCRRLFLNLTGPLEVRDHWASSIAEQQGGQIFYPDVVYSGEDYTYSVEAARLVVHEDVHSLYCLLQVVHKNPWLSAPDLPSMTSAEDNLGYRYPAERESAQAETALYLSGEIFTGGCGGDELLAQSSPFVTYYNLWVIDIAPEASKITLFLDYYGTLEFALTIPLEGGALS